MCHAAGHLDKTLHTAQTLRKREDLCGFAESLCGLFSAVNSEAEHASTHAVAVLLYRDFPVRVGFDARVVDGLDVRGGFESSSDSGCVLGGFAGTEVEGLQTTVGQPAIEGGGDSADGVLEEGETFLELVGVEGCYAHQ